MRRALILVGVLVAVAVAGPLVAPYGPVTRFDDHLHAPPMPLHLDGRGLYTVPLRLVDRLEQTFAEDSTQRAGLPWTTPAATPVLLLGADRLGRDVLSRTLHGARASLGLALVATAGTLLLGAILGGWAGMAGGLVERLVLKAGDVLMVLPVLYVVVALRAALPLVLPLPVVVAVLAEATLSYVGLGFPDGVPSWGTALSEAATISAMTRAPWTLAPALAMFLVVLATNVLLEPARERHTPDVARSG